MDNEDRKNHQSSIDRLEALWREASRDTHAEAAFLRELSRQGIVTLLLQPPGPGPAAPEHNLVCWQRNAEGTAFVPVFTSVQQINFRLPPPAKVVRVPMRSLLVALNGRRCIVNPLSDAAFELGQTRLARLLDYLAKDHQEVGSPSRIAPWIFRLPHDSLYSVAVKLGEWFIQHGRVNRAFLYELLRGGSSSAEIVLGLDEPTDIALADTLTVVAIQAGVDPAHFIVRFLPDEPSHREGVLRGGITPFYHRPEPPLH